MGSPVSVVVAEIVMQNIEEQALSTYTKTLTRTRFCRDDRFVSEVRTGTADCLKAVGLKHFFLCDSL